MGTGSPITGPNLLGFKHVAAKIIQDVGPHINGIASNTFLLSFCDREISIVAETQQDKKRIIGAVRLIVELGRNRGEFAIVVSDQWQGKGFESKLLDYMIEIGKNMKLERSMAT